MRTRILLATIVATLILAPTTALGHNHRAHRPPAVVAHKASCGNVCLLANAYPGWVCDLQGGIVAAGIWILSDGASEVWTILGGSSWTAGCHVIQDYIFNSATEQKLRSDGVNCFYTWSKPGRQGIRRERCQSWYA